MGIFDRFPYSSTHEMNLDFMLGKATEIAEDMQTVATGMAQVQAGLSAISEKTEQATQAAAQAAQSASSIEGSVTAAEEAAEEAQMHNESAQTWANNAMTYKADCQRSATEAAQAATAAAGSEDTVAQYAQAANASAQSAANNNDSAHQYANQASASASNATFHSSNAQTAATNAQTAATNANTSATNAAASADRAATLKTDVETLHRMCVTAVDQAAEQAVAAGNSAGQAAATKTEVENLVESLPEDFTDLNNTVNQLSDDIGDLKSAFISAIEEYKPNILNPNLLVPNKMIDASNNVYSNSSYEYLEYTSVKSGHSYSLAEMNDRSFYSGVYISIILVYKSSDRTQFQRVTQTNDGANKYFTIPSGYDLVRLVLKYSELYAPDGTLMLYDTENGYFDEIYQYGEVKERTLNESPYVTNDVFVQTILPYDKKIANASRVPDILDFKFLKWNMDNFQRETGESMTDGYQVIGATDGAVISTVGEHTKKLIKNPNSSNRLIMWKTVSENQCVCFSGDKAYLVFNIIDINNFYFLVPFRTVNNNSVQAGFQLYKRENGSSSFLIAKAFHEASIPIKDKWFNVVVFKENKIKIYNDYILVGEFETDVPFNETAGMIFNLYNDESYSTFGVCDYIGVAEHYGVDGAERYINNKSSESVSLSSTGVLKLLVDRAQGYSDGSYYRSMIAFSPVRYDNCFCRFSCEFRLDESLSGADDFLILQWHDNDLYKSSIATSPFLSVDVFNVDGSQKVCLGSRYSNWKPAENQDCVIIPNIDLCAFDTEWHKIDIEARIGYDAEMLPYLCCKFDGETVFSKTLPMGYRGQNGYNISLGIYGWVNQTTGNPWASPASDKPFAEFKGIKYIG